MFHCWELVLRDVFEIGWKNSSVCWMRGYMLGRSADTNVDTSRYISLISSREICIPSFQLAGTKMPSFLAPKLCRCFPDGLDSTQEGARASLYPDNRVNFAVPFSVVVRRGCLFLMCGLRVLGSTLTLYGSNPHVPLKSNANYEEVTQGNEAGGLFKMFTLNC
jgi:hypothetical protein